MKIEDLFKNEEFSDDNFTSYNFTKGVKIFNCEVQKEDMDNCIINVSNLTNLNEVSDVITDYFNWLTNCEEEVKNFYEQQTEKKVHKNWFSELSVFGFDINIINENLYSAIISCGETIPLKNNFDIYFNMNSLTNIEFND